jgi:hypothetical protein
LGVDGSGLLSDDDDGGGSGLAGGCGRRRRAVRLDDGDHLVLGQSARGRGGFGFGLVRGLGRVGGGRGGGDVGVDGLDVGDGDDDDIHVDAVLVDVIPPEGHRSGGDAAGEEHGRSRSDSGETHLELFGVWVWVWVRLRIQRIIVRCDDLRGIGSLIGFILFLLVMYALTVPVCFCW